MLQLALPCFMAPATTTTDLVECKRLQAVKDKKQQEDKDAQDACMFLLSTRLHFYFFSFQYL